MQLTVTWAREDRVLEAKRVLAAVPNETDEEIRNHLAREYADAGETPNPAGVSAEDVQQFRTYALPRLKDEAAGKPPAADEEEVVSLSEGMEELDKNPWMKFVYVFFGYGMGGFGAIFVGLGAAYKLCTHAGGD